MRIVREQYISKFQPPPLRFDFAAAEDAWQRWGANCGPGAIAAICGLSLEELRPSLGDFEQKRYTNPTMMWEILRRLGVTFRVTTRKHHQSPNWPYFGLARIQWEGPWTEPGVPLAARYRHTHWVGAMRGRHSIGIFDINCINSGGWVRLEDWDSVIVPFLIEHHAQRANGNWHITHSVEIERKD